MLHLKNVPKTVMQVDGTHLEKLVNVFVLGALVE